MESLFSPQLTLGLAGVLRLVGLGATTRLVSALQHFMEEHQFSTPSDFRGLVCDRIVGNDDVDRRRLRVAAIDRTACTACGRCYDVCIYNAVQPGEEYSIIPESCSGCGLCSQVCPVPCIEMVPAPD